LGFCVVIPLRLTAVITIYGRGRQCANVSKKSHLLRIRHRRGGHGRICKAASRGLLTPFRRKRGASRSTDGRRGSRRRQVWVVICVHRDNLKAESAESQLRTRLLFVKVVAPNIHFAQSAPVTAGTPVAHPSIDAPSVDDWIASFCHWINIPIPPVFDSANVAGSPLAPRSATPTLPALDYFGPLPDQRPVPPGAPPPRDRSFGAGNVEDDVPIKRRSRGCGKWSRAR